MACKIMPHKDLHNSNNSNRTYTVSFGIMYSYIKQLDNFKTRNYNL